MNNYASNTKKDITQLIKKTTNELGFDFCGIAPVEKLTSEKLNYEKWLSKGCQGKMSYLEKNIHVRYDPALLVQNAKSVISLAVNYFSGKKQNESNYYKISKYAYGKDYHSIMKKMMSTLLTKLQEKIPKLKGRGFVDSAPVMEKIWAQKAGLGWMGKNGNLIIPKHGSSYFLCELIVDIELDYDTPFEKNYCGNCTECIDNCPTSAIDEKGFVDAQKCISYLTIELKDYLDNNNEYPKYKNWIFGCDICQDICPWNRFAKPDINNRFDLNNDILKLTDKDWEELSKDQYSSIIKKSESPISRIKYEKLKSNIRFAKSTK